MRLFQYLLLAFIFTASQCQGKSFDDIHCYCTDYKCTATVPAGSLQPNYRDAEFVSRSLANDGNIPNLDALDSQEAYASYKYNGIVYDLLRAGGTFGLRDLLLVLGWVPSANAIETMSVVFIDGSDEPHSHTLIGVGPNLCSSHHPAKCQIPSCNTSWTVVEVFQPPRQPHSRGATAGDSISSTMLQVRAASNGSMSFISYMSNGNGNYADWTANFATTTTYLQIFPFRGNNDFETDVLQVLSNAGTMSFNCYLSQGNGIFSVTPSTYGGYPTTFIGMFPTDINGDNLDDILEFWDNAGFVSFVTYINQGSCSFKPVMTSYPKPSYSIKIFAADLNGDGMSDVVQVVDGGCTYCMKLVSYFSMGDGTFNPVIEFNTTISKSSIMAMLPMMINSDTKEDILQITNLGGSLLGFNSYLSNGDGTFDIKYRGLSNSDGAYLSGDLNGDGVIDVLQVYYDYSSTMSFSSFFSHGDGTFTPVITKNFQSGAVYRYPQYLPIDANGDGLLDVVQPLYSSSMQLATSLSLGNGSFTPVSTTYAEPYDYLTIFTMQTRRS